MVTGLTFETSDDPEPRIVIADGQLNVPVVQSLRPDEGGVVIISTKEELLSYKKRIWGSSGTAGAIAPTKFDVQDMGCDTYLLKVHRYQGDLLLTTHMTEVTIYQLGKSMPAKISTMPSLKIEPQRATCVIGIEVEKTTKTEDLWTTLSTTPVDTKAALTLVRQRKVQGVNEQDILDLFLPTMKDGLARCLIRTTVQARDLVLASSGRDAVYCSPSPSDHAKYTIVWFPRQQVANVEEAVRLAAGKPHLMGLVCKRNAQNGPTFGLRTTTQHRDDLATALGRLPGARYALHGCPVDWVEAEVQQLCDSMQWRAAPVQGSQRMKRSSAIWSVRALDPPPLASVVVSTGDEKVIIRVVEPSSASSKARPKKEEVSQVRTWSTILPAQHRSGKKSDPEHSREVPQPQGAVRPEEDEEYEKEAKRKRPASVQRQEEQAAPRQPTFPVHPPPAHSPLQQDSPLPNMELAQAMQTMAAQLQTLQTFMQTMQNQVGQLNDKVGKIDSVVHDMIHPEEDDEEEENGADHNMGGPE